MQERRIPTGRDDLPSEIVAESASTELRIRLLGVFRVSIGNRTIGETAWRLRKAAHLVKMLALSSGHRLHREQVLDRLWPDLPPEAAGNNFRVTLHAARRTLGLEDARGILRLHAESLSLASAGSLWIDIEAFEVAAEAARQAEDPAAYRRAINLYTGDLLPDDLYEDWIIERRETLRATCLSLLLDLARLHERRGEPKRAIEALQRLLTRDRIFEEAHVDLMRLYAVTGRRRQALRQYHQLRNALQQELEVEPHSASARLYEDILSGRFLAEPDQPPVRPVAILSQRVRPAGPASRSDERERTNLPVQLTSFIGRERELDAVRQLLDERQLITLTGPGGSGKTRLAVEAAGTLLNAYPDGVWLVDLAGTSDPASIVPMAAAVLAVRDRPGQPLLEALSAYLRDKQLLLLFDNCEHLIEGCAELIEMLLRSCPSLHIVATSREPLRLPGEAVQPVPPLAMLDPRNPVPLKGLRRVEAVQLFVERAQLVQPGFALTGANAPAIAQICLRLEGMPLAIELAAARTRSLPVEQLAARLDEALQWLTGGSRTAPGRHQTLRAAIAWSWDLLTEPEQRLMGWLTVFAGGWAIEAAEAICAGGIVPRAEVLDLLFQLVDKSLVIVEERAEARYRLLETVRQYAVEQLEASGEAARIRQEHANYYLLLVERRAPGFRGPEAATWLPWWYREHDNLRAALTFSIENGKAEQALRLGRALWRFWALAGYLTEGRQWLARILAMEGASAFTESRMRALFGAGRLAYVQGDYLAAHPLFEQSMVIARQLGNRDYIAGGLIQLAHIASRQGDYAAARSLYEQGLVMRREQGDMWYIAVTLDGLGQVVRAQGDYPAARALFEESLALYQEVGDPLETARSFYYLGMLARLEGNHESARAQLNESLARWRALSNRSETARVLVELGHLASDQGDFRLARSSLAESLSLYQELGIRPGIVDCLEGIASLSIAQGRARQGLRLLGAAAALRKAISIPRPSAERANYERTLAQARGMVNPEEWTAAWSAGRAMPLEQAIDDALSGTSD